MDAQKQTAPGANRRGSNGIALSSVRGFYHGSMPPAVVPAPRDPLTVARDLHSAAECLADLAEDFAAGAFDDGLLSSADRLLVGAGRLIVELRQRKEARQ